MKTAFVILALAAACVASNATVMYDAGIVEDVDVPKEGWWHGVFTISATDAEYIATAGSAAGIEFTVDPTLFDVTTRRSIDFYATPEATDAPNSSYKIVTFDYSTRTATVNLTTIGASCGSGCSVYFHLYANCKLESCINSLTTDIWARIKLANGQYLYSTTAGAAHHVVLYENVKTMEFDVSASEVHYFQYINSGVAVDLPLLIDSGYFDQVSIVGSSTLTEPTETNLTWVQSKSKQTRTWPANSSTAIGVVGSTKIGSTASYQLCVGSECSAAPAVVAAFASLIAALLAHLF